MTNNNNNKEMPSSSKMCNKVENFVLLTHVIINAIKKLFLGLDFYSKGYYTLKVLIIVKKSIICIYFIVPSESV